MPNINVGASNIAGPSPKTLSGGLDIKGKGRATNVDPDSLTVSSTSSSASAAFARSIALYMGFLFRRPSKLFRPSRVDTWGGLRHLAISADQSLSPSFIRSLLRTRSGLLAVLLTLTPPLIVNTALGFLLFSSHSLFALTLARLSFFEKDAPDGHGKVDNTEELTMETLLRGPTVTPRHPTGLSAIAGAGAGMVQGMAFTPIENIVKWLRDSATSVTGLMIRFLRLPIRPHSPLNDINLPSNPVQALNTFLSTDSWRKSPSWWSGWRWTVTRDAVSYAVFFAAFDMTRRAGLRVKAFFGGGVQREWQNFVVLDGIAKPNDGSSSPKIARIAQASTIVAGGIAASLAAGIVGRPFKACQQIMLDAKSSPSPQKYPILHVLRNQGVSPFIGMQKPVEAVDPSRSALGRAMRRLGWRMAAVGPWGFGFLAWAWVGGEV